MKAKTSCNIHKAIHVLNRFERIGGRAGRCSSNKVAPPVQRTKYTDDGGVALSSLAPVQGYEYLSGAAEGASYY
jgi:hypothetical protein